jgi:hypothetical protein
VYGTFLSSLRFENPLLNFLSKGCGGRWFETGAILSDGGGVGGFLRRFRDGELVDGDVAHSPPDQPIVGWHRLGFSRNPAHLKSLLSHPAFALLDGLETLRTCRRFAPGSTPRCSPGNRSLITLWPLATGLLSGCHPAM